MKFRQRRISRSVALFLVFATTQIYVGLSFAGSKPSMAHDATAVPIAVPTSQPATGSLTTQGNQPITLNGETAISGATLLSGASLETPDGVGGSVNLGALGSLQVEPNTKLTLEFQSGSVKVLVTKGCLSLRTKKGTSGEIDTLQGVAGKTYLAKDGVINSCPSPAIPPQTAGGGGGSGLFGIGVGETISLLTLTGTIVTVTITNRGRNPSPVIL